MFATASLCESGALKSPEKRIEIYRIDLGCEVLESLPTALRLAPWKRKGAQYLYLRRKNEYQYSRSAFKLDASPISPPTPWIDIGEKLFFITDP
jgi:hypothetical protein